VLPVSWGWFLRCHLEHFVYDWFCLCGAILNLKAFCFGSIPNIMIELIAYWSMSQSRQSWQWLSGIETKLLEASGYCLKEIVLSFCETFYYFPDKVCIVSTDYRIQCHTCNRWSNKDTCSSYLQRWKNLATTILIEPYKDLWIFYFICVITGSPIRLHHIVYIHVHYIF
jgi:hypothetical protein